MLLGSRHDWPHGVVRPAAPLGPRCIDARADGAVRPRRLGPREGAEEWLTPHRHRASGRARRDPATPAARARRHLFHSAGNRLAKGTLRYRWRSIAAAWLARGGRDIELYASGTLPRRYNASAVSRPRTPLSNLGEADGVAPRVPPVTGDHAVSESVHQTEAVRPPCRPAEPLACPSSAPRDTVGTKRGFSSRGICAG